MNRKNIALIMSAGICMSGICSNLPMSFTGKAMIGTLAADEADIFDQLPHTLDEFNEFTEKYGVVSVYDNFIVYCDSVNYSTGAEIVLQQLGTAEIEEVKHYSVDNGDEPLPPGSTDHVVYVYKAVSPGTVKVTWMQGQPWYWEESKEERSLDYFEVDDKLSISTIEKEDFILTVRGDANGDGVFNIADAVMLQKWLLCGDELTYWQNADFYKDDKIDVFDFCLMKKELIEKSNSDYKILETKNFYGNVNMENIKNSAFYAEDMNSLLTHINIAEVCKKENCKCDYHDASALVPDQIDESFFDENVAVVVYNSYGAGNKTLTVDRLENVGGYLTVYTTTNIPEFATPDMTYYRSVIAVSKKYFGDTHKVIRKDTVVEN